jgi:putative PIN family toxin of toxin-antitoxin system
MKIVIDTNVWVSALVFGGKPRQVFEFATEQGIKIVVSEGLLSEIRRVLSQKFPKFVPKFENLLVRYKMRLHYVDLGSISVTVCRDPKDNMILETAVIGKSDYIISGDDDLLSLKKYQNITILNPADFLKSE